MNDQITDPGAPYMPLLSEYDQYEETPEEYAARMKPPLPHWPENILINWFYRHWNDIANYANKLTSNKLAHQSSIRHVCLLRELS